jgi:preprotein translocase subunit SecF
MEFFRIRRDIPFMRHALVFNIISLVTFLAAVFFLFTRGLHLSIEFTGGTVIEVAYAQPADIGKVRGTVESMKVGDTQVQNFGSARDVPKASSRANWSGGCSTRCAGPKAARSSRARVSATRGSR